MASITEILNRHRLLTDYLKDTGALIPPIPKHSIKGLITEAAALQMLCIGNSSVSGSWLADRVPPFGVLSDGSRMYPEWAIELLSTFVLLADLYRQLDHNSTTHLAMSKAKHKQPTAGDHMTRV